MKIRICCVRNADGLFSKVLNGNSKGRVQTNSGHSTPAFAAALEHSEKPARQHALVKAIS
jgi:hypothetical protein